MSWAHRAHVPWRTRFQRVARVAARAVGPRCRTTKQTNQWCTTGRMVWKWKAWSWGSTWNPRIPTFPGLRNADFSIFFHIFSMALPVPWWLETSLFTSCWNHQDLLNSVPASKPVWGKTYGPTRIEWHWKQPVFVGLVLYVFHVSGRRRLEDVAFEASGLPISGWSAPALWISYIPRFNGQLLTFTWSSWLVADISFLETTSRLHPPVLLVIRLLRCLIAPLLLRTFACCESFLVIFPWWCRCFGENIFAW